MVLKIFVDHKTLVFSRTGRMCIGGSGLCMEGEQRKNQSPARRAGSRVWVRDSDPDWSQRRSQRRDQGAGGVTDTQWSQSIM